MEANSHESSRCGLICPHEDFYCLLLGRSGWLDMVGVHLPIISDLAIEYLLQGSSSVVKRIRLTTLLDPLCHWGIIEGYEKDSDCKS